MTRIALAIALAGLLIGAGLLLSGRYDLVQDRGFVVWRLDRLSGEVMLCGTSAETGALCRTMPTDQATRAVRRTPVDHDPFKTKPGKPLSSDDLPSAKLNTDRLVPVPDKEDLPHGLKAAPDSEIPPVFTAVPE